MLENTKVPGLDFTWEEVNNSIKNNRLLSFDLEFSRRCNINCLYCYSRKNLPKSNEELSFDELRDIIFQAVQLGAKNVVNIGGGEPMLYKHYWDILEYERQVGLKSITFTNGTLINSYIASRLFNMKEDIALKFNSFDEDTQDALAGVKGTGKKIKYALDCLINAGYTLSESPNLALETIVCKQNYHEIEEIYMFCRENNIIPYVEILTEQGAALENTKSIAVSPEKNYELFKKLLQYDEENWGVSWPLTPPIAGQTCKRMLYSAYITSTGNVQPCPGVEIITEDSNIRKNKLADILKHSKVFRECRGIYENLKGPCKNCVHKDCYGCRGTALFQGGNYLASDPSCWYISVRKENFSSCDRIGIPVTV